LGSCGAVFLVLLAGFIIHIIVFIIVQYFVIFEVCFHSTLCNNGRGESGVRLAESKHALLIFRGENRQWLYII